MKISATRGNQWIYQIFSNWISFSNDYVEHILHKQRNTVIDISLLLRNAPIFRVIFILFFSPINRNDTRSNEKGIVFPFTRGKIIMSMYIYTNAKHRKCSYIDSIQSTIQLKNDSYFHFKETTNNVCLRIDIHSAYNCCPSKIHYAHLEATFTIETWLSPYHITLNCTNLIRWTSPSSECRARSAF